MLLSLMVLEFLSKKLEVSQLCGDSWRTHPFVERYSGPSSDHDEADPTYRALKSNAVGHEILDLGAARTCAIADSCDEQWLALNKP